ncbi:hypothetical protein [Streptacidiphilus jiangxiensis]|uniref:Uncharacterized protein n=1 Tax=Streptacidiphilus jiangxiensis TaxID=235985 RepID=A0A1H7MQU9_STRJI|nr:hypothetical protein [Streptacidiphilus jiangxiensis]SEL13449.1 hypothetical protein SAMN05414137_1068 [Streptacidiphilus jiangxiensis]
MSAVVAGVTTGAVVSGGLGLSAWVVHRRRSPKTDFRRADRFAREMDLYLPEAMVAPVAARLRRRSVLALLLAAMLGGPFLGYLVGTFVAQLNSDAVDHVDIEAVPFPGPAGAVVGMVFGLLIGTVEDLWELVRTRRESVPEAESWSTPAATIPLRQAVPVWLIRTARVLTVGPALVAAAACATQNRGSLALGFLALVPVCGAVGWSAERLQRWMLNTRQLPSSGDLLPQAAFDRAFRVVALLPILLLAPSVCILLGAFYIHLVGRGLWYQNLMFAWTATAFPILILNALLNATWAKRHHRRLALGPTAPTAPTAPAE